ncbi:hypothetical protein [Synechococcus sp. H65.1]|uniref:hypothetical protein n=1 Tax=unclassified Synechococcus TaxID=2626047 RepID=UPI0039C4071D
MLKPLVKRTLIVLLASGLGLLGCGDPNVPLTQPPPDAFRVSTPRPPRLDLYPTPPPPPPSTPAPPPSLLELTARWLGIPWPPPQRETSPLRLSARFLEIPLPPKPSPRPARKEERRQSHKT